MKPIQFDVRIRRSGKQVPCSRLVRFSRPFNLKSLMGVGKVMVPLSGTLNIIGRIQQGPPKSAVAMKLAGKVWEPAAQFGVWGFRVQGLPWNKNNERIR